MSKTSSFLVNRFENAFSWSKYLIVKKYLKDDTGRRVWFNEDIVPQHHYKQRLIIGLSSVNDFNDTAWIRQYKTDDIISPTIEFDMQSISFRCTKLGTTMLLFEEFKRNEYDAIAEEMFKQILIKLDNGYDIKCDGEVLFRNGTAYNLLIERDL